MSFRSYLSRLPVAAAAILCVGVANADEGMWTFDSFPAALVQQRYGVEIDQPWLDRVRAATIRLANCTASFVSGEGLALTNQHCVASCLAQLSRTTANLLRDGYLAQSRDEELRCQTQYADVLVKMEDITASVAAATAGKDAQSAHDARRKTLTQLEQACEAASAPQDPRHCEAVSLYGGGQHFLYHYKRYDDVRLAFAPEYAIAAFGGDPDNFQFPRWCLDVALLRIYENGQPVATPDHLVINWNGPGAGDPVFVAGHPGSTSRQLTVAQLQTQRALLPASLLRASELRGRYIQFASIGPEQARIVREPLSAIENTIKRNRNQLDALLDPALLERKRSDEAALMARSSFPAGEDPWQAIARASERQLELSVPYAFIEESAGFNSALYRYARTLVRGAAERARPNQERLREYVDTALPKLVQQLAASVPVYAEREILTLTFGLERMREALGPDYPLVRNLLAELAPDELANALVYQSRLADPELRLQLWEGGLAAIEASDDPMIRIALLVEPEARALRMAYEEEVKAVTDAASEQIAAARFAALGTSVYPDATFTLRLNFGAVQGWVERGASVAPFTTLERAFERATGSDPFHLPESWTSRREQLDMATPFNLSSGNDIVGGNSGSPLISAQGEVVGVLFDGNIHSIAGTYWFDAAKNRSVSVHPAIIREALTKIYDAGELARELGL